MMSLKAILIFTAVCASEARSSQWTAAVEVRHDDNLCVSYQARLDGPFLVVRATLQPGWHTFAMDNKQRAEEKLAGKRSLGIDHPTEITLSAGLEPLGSWYQSPPNDFSKPELRWYSWGFEQQAAFVTRIRRSGTGTARIAVRGQVCTETTCKNIDVAISLPLAGANPSDAPEIDLKNLIRVR
jgi:DsbC/DsbD-like thiol-disulfide interchange protein